VSPVADVPSEEEVAAQRSALAAAAEPVLRVIGTCDADMPSDLTEDNMTMEHFASRYDVRDHACSGRL
jgi:hypothetical protein